MEPQVTEQTNTSNGRGRGRRLYNPLDRMGPAQIAAMLTAIAKGEPLFAAPAGSIPTTTTGSGPSKPQSAALTRFLGGRAYSTKYTRYYSKVRIPATSGVAGTSGFASTQGAKATAFGYYVGQDMASAGYTAGAQTATYADTNLQTANQTIAGEAVEVHGVGAILLGTSDPVFTKFSDGQVSVTLKLNGNQSYYLGVPVMVPGPGGLMGVSEALSAYPDQLSQVGVQIGALSNGLPYAANYQAFEEPFVWASAGNADSNLQIQFVNERVWTTPVQYGGAARTAVAGGADTPGTAAYTPPLFGAVFIEYMVVLEGMTVVPLSVN